MGGRRNEYLTLPLGELIKQHCQVGMCDFPFGRVWLDVFGRSLVKAAWSQFRGNLCEDA